MAWRWLGSGVRTGGVPTKDLPKSASTGKEDSMSLFKSSRRKVGMQGPKKVALT